MFANLAEGQRTENVSQPRVGPPAYLGIISFFSLPILNFTRILGVQHTRGYFRFQIWGKRNADATHHDLRDRSEGTSEMTLQEMANAIRGGLELETVELTLDQDESKRLERKRLAIARVNELLRNMTPDQVERAIDLLQSRDDLMNLADDYA